MEPSSDRERTDAVAPCALCGGRGLPLPGSPQALRCAACGFVFAWPRPDPRAVARYYSRAGKYASWERDAPGRAAADRARLRILRRHARGGRLLDVGAGVGSFLAEARRRFEVFGTEVSREAIRAARERFGLDLREAASDEDPGLAAGSLDAATLIHVLEHVPSPAATLERCRALLRPGGVLLVAVPNDGPLGWFKARNGGRRMLGVLLSGRGRSLGYDPRSPIPPPDLDDPAGEVHLSHFGPDTLRLLLERSGFDQIALVPDPYRPLTGMRRLRDAAERRFWSCVHEASRLFCYEAMLAIARRRG